MANRVFFQAIMCKRHKSGQHELVDLSIDSMYAISQEGGCGEIRPGPVSTSQEERTWFEI